MIRYRTGGMRRTWQNKNRWDDGHNTNAPLQVAAHPREDPYHIPPTLYHSDNPLPPNVRPPTGSGSTTSGGQSKITPTVSYSSAQERATIHIPRRPPRPSRSSSPGRMLDEQMMEDIQKGP